MTANTELTGMQKLQAIQQELKAPKGQVNSFGGYNYRSCEDIFEAVKPLLAKYNCVLSVTDGVEYTGAVYIKATARLINTDNGDVICYADGYARHAETKKGMDEAQITGACSSYARKYALNGLFLIDDVKDADSTNKHGKDEPKANRTPVKKDDKPYAKDIDGDTVEMVKTMGWTQAQCLKYWNECGATKAEFAECVRINHESTTELPI
jgi:hypothetical protein